MNARLSYVVAPLLTLALVVLGFVWWYGTMEKQWNITVAESDAAIKNPMLGAQRLLERHNHQVKVEETLSSLLFKPVIPRGTIILAANEGLMNKTQVTQLLSWVLRGNNLIMVPAWGVPAAEALNAHDDDDGGQPANVNNAKPSKKDATNNDKDDVGAHFGVALEFIGKEKEACRDESVDEEKQKQKLPKDFTIIDCSANFTVPDSAYALHLGQSRQKLVANESYRRSAYSDDEGKAVRSYSYGKGQVIFVSQNYFDNRRLPYYDRAELLLALVEQNHDARRVTIVQHLDNPSWYQVLWAMVPQTLIALGIALALLGWAAVRRFGPMLPEPDIVRRSMLEHVEASSRWLWKSAKGREMLFDAARDATMKVLLRRIPQLHAMPEEEKVALLAQQTGLLRSDIDAALHNIAAKPQEYTRQIQTLQRLRKHYER